MSIQSAAQAHAVRVGRPSDLSAEQIGLSRQLIEDRQTPRAVAHVFKVHPATLYRAMNADFLE